MRTRKLDSNGDYSFGSNSQDYVDDIRSIAQNIQTKVKLYYGEWWEDIGIGIPMFQAIIGKMNTEAIKMSASLLIEKRVLEVPDVLSVSNVEVLKEGRTLKFTVTAETVLGPVSVGVLA